MQDGYLIDPKIRYKLDNPDNFESKKFTDEELQDIYEQELFKFQFLMVQNTCLKDGSYAAGRTSRPYVSYFKLSDLS